MIYGRAGQQVTIKRWATLEDVRALTGRKADKQDREALANKSYVVTVDSDTGKERLHHLAFMRYDGKNGEDEIGRALAALPVLLSQWCEMHPEDGSHERMPEENRCVYCSAEIQTL